MSNCLELQRLKRAANLANTCYRALLDECERLQTVTGLQPQAILDSFLQALAASQAASAECDRHANAYGCGAIEAEDALRSPRNPTVSRG